jgi:hypothetical protein
MALVTIFAIATIVIAIKRREFLLAIVAVITGIMLMTTGTDWGTTVTKTLTTLSDTVDSIFTK